MVLISIVNEKREFLLRYKDNESTYEEVSSAKEKLVSLTKGNLGNVVVLGKY